MNGVLSLRYNKFKNRGGNKGRSIDGNNAKCEAFEILGSWMSRLIMWQLGLGDAIFAEDHMAPSDDKKVLWRTGRRILYDTPDTVAGQSTEQKEENLPAYQEFDRWVSEDRIFLHASDYEMDELHYTTRNNVLASYVFYTL